MLLQMHTIETLWCHAFVVLSFVIILCLFVFVWSTEDYIILSTDKGNVLHHLSNVDCH